MAASRLTRPVMELHNEPLQLTAPFRISGYVFEAMPATVVTLREGDIEGRGEAAGVYYMDDRPENMLATLEALRDTIEAGISRMALREILPPGGARNALDCALWELEARRVGVPVWKLAGLADVKPLLTTFTIGADAPGTMASTAVAYPDARALKLKLTGDVDLDIERVRAVRAARTDVWLAVDANQGYEAVTLATLVPALLDAEVSLLEQPCRRGHEADIDGIDPAMQVAADESVLSLAELERMSPRFDVVNIKLDKCGGLTEGLLMAERARAMGRKVMVGNMAGTSLAMAPAFVLGQLCDVVDLDGPAMLMQDRTPGVVYADGYIDCPDTVWGGAQPPRNAATPCAAAPVVTGEPG